MAIGVVHGLGGGISLVKQEVTTNTRGFKIVYAEYSNGYVVMDAIGTDVAWQPNSTVTVKFDFPNGVKLDPASYVVTTSVGRNGQLVRDLLVMADGGGNPKYDETGFNYSWWQTAKYQIGFHFHIAGMKKA
nr:MAG TPA: hypothetical protein [Caudoviricetes sp.]